MARFRRFFVLKLLEEIPLSGNNFTDFISDPMSSENPVFMDGNLAGKLCFLLSILGTVQFRGHYLISVLIIAFLGEYKMNIKKGF